MKGMYKVDYQGLQLLQKNFTKQMLRMASGYVIECVEEECCIIFCPKGKEHIMGFLDAATIRDCPITVTECNKGDFSAKEVNDFFERIETIQDSILEILPIMGKTC